MLHHEAPLGDIHKLHNWDVADPAALAALVVVAGDVGKVARVISTLQFFVLLATGTPNTWAQLSHETPLQAVKSSSGASYTILDTDINAYIRVSHATEVAIIVEDEATLDFPVGTMINFIQTGAGQLAFAAAGGVTINSSETLKTRKEHSAVSLLKVASDTWDLFGDLDPV